MGHLQTTLGSKTSLVCALQDPAEYPMFYVYLLRSESHTSQVYTGYTEDLRQRLAEHNSGKSPHTSQYRPWGLETYLAFSDRNQAQAFERYLKTGSGIAFANKRLRSSAQAAKKCPPTRPP